MDIESIEVELQKAFPGSDLSVSNDGSLLQLTILAEQFNDFNRVRRQQMVYAVIQHRIKSGEVHAVSMHVHAPGDKRG